MSTFYNRAKWEHLRSLILRRDGYQCQLSKRYGKMVKADMVHHIFPAEDFPEYIYEPWNLISLCTSAHNTLHDRQSRALTEEGIALLKRTARKYHVSIPIQFQNSIPPD